MQHPVKRRSHGMARGRFAMFWSNGRVSGGGGGWVAASFFREIEQIFNFAYCTPVQVYILPYLVHVLRAQYYWLILIEIFLFCEKS